MQTELAKPNYLMIASYMRPIQLHDLKFLTIMNTLKLLYTLYPLDEILASFSRLIWSSSQHEI